MKTRKELKEDYKHMEFQAGVFQIRNLLNGKIFVGSTADLNTAWNSQRFKLNAGLHPNSLLMQDWKYFGEENFVYEILEILKATDDKHKDEKELKILENIVLGEVQPFGAKGYHSK